MFDKSKGETSYVKNEWIVLRASERRTVANNEIAANNISVYSCDLLDDPKYNDIMELMEALNSEVFIGSSFYNSRKNYNTLVQGTNLETGHNTPITRHLMNEDMQKEINSMTKVFGSKDEWVDIDYITSLIGMNFGQLKSGEDFKLERPELKKYDVFYWGMGKQYRPQIAEKCYNSTNGDTPNPNTSGSIIRVAKTDLYDFITNDDNSQAFNKASFWRPKQFTYKSAVYYPVGDIVIGPRRNGDKTNSKKRVGGITLPQLMNGPARETILVSGDVKGPINYELLWTNDGWTTSGNKKPNIFWIWRPIAPVNYIALGDVITTSADPPQTGDNAPIRCVPFDMVIKLPANRNILWSSNGSPVDINVNLLGFKPNDGRYQGADGGNAYNLFRAVIGWGTTIPASDINGNFYYLDTTKYNASFVLGVDTGRPDSSDEGNRVGKGYIPTPKRDSKYSVIAYLNLKNNPVLKHQKTTFQMQGQLIPNAISNSYILKNGNKCLDYVNNTIKLSQCDELVDSQYFSILFTGNMKNQCTLKHQKTGNILKYNSGIFTLVKPDVIDNAEQTLFIMQ
jgi:hypothetical protein